LAIFEVHVLEEASGDFDGELGTESTWVAFESLFVFAGGFVVGFEFFGGHVVHCHDASGGIEEDDVDVDEAITHDKCAEA